VAVEESIEREYYRVSDQLLYERANIEECGMGELLLNTHHAPTSVSLRLGRGLVARWTLHSYYAFNAKRERERTRSFPCLATANHFRSLPFLLRNMTALVQPHGGEKIAMQRRAEPWHARLER
jgi:hypothetical protein